jgi:predicted MPP superfamily phosphohydrolase
VSLFFLLFLSMPLVDLAWWRWADVRLRVNPRLWIARVLLGLFILAEVAQFLWLLAARGFGVKVHSPVLLLGSAYLWHLVVLPVLAVATLLWLLVQAVLRTYRPAHPAPPTPITALAEQRIDGLSRREFLLAGAVLAPPALCLGATGYGISRRDNFRLNRVDVPLPSLPRELDGATIAHVSDIHLGKFTDERILRNVIAATNDLRADVIAFTGDLIDFDLSDLHTALDYMKKLDSPGGVYLCEGNHDLFQSRSVFENTVKRSGVPLLLDEVSDVSIRGRQLQLLGIKWESGGTKGHSVFRHHLQRLNPRRDPDAFPVLLAHHPHAFDRARDFGIPLTLSGHTHGGQLMLSNDIGGGPMLFRYWSGLYQKDNAALFVNNGVGNWFPLRVNAPAEIALITLRSTAA